MRVLSAVALVSVLVASAPAWAGCAAAEGPIKINEFIPNPTGTDGGQEWIELYNTSGSPVSIDGFKLATKTSASSFSTKYTFPASTTIPANGYLVVADGAFPALPCEGTSSCSFIVQRIAGTGTFSIGGDSSNNGDAVRLVNASDQVVDIVAYLLGTAVPPIVVPDECNDPALVADMAGVPAEGQTLARSPNGADTDRSIADFQIGAPTLGTSNGGGGGSCDASTHTSGLVINEFMPDPAGNEGQNLEWIELYNGTGSSVNLEGYRFEYAGTPGSFSTKYTFGDVTLANGAFLMVGESASNPGGGVTFLQSGTLAMGSGSGGDALRLMDCSATPNVVDTVVYGGNGGSTPFNDDNGNPITTNFAPTPGDGRSLARKTDGADTQNSATDFEFRTVATPGVTNGGGPGPTCDPSTHTSGLVINEFMPDPAGAEGQNLEWIELYNDTGSSVNLEGYRFEYAGTPGSFSTKYTFGDVTLANGAFLVVGESASNPGGVTFLQSGTLSLGSGSGGDALRMMDCSATPNVVDTVVYGGNGGATPFNDDNGNPITTNFAPTPGDGRALARKTDGADTQNSATDFESRTSSTPGLSNDVTPPNCDPSNTATGLVINEFMPDPLGAEGQNLEWIELYNGSGSSIDLDGYKLQFAGSSSYSVKYTFSGTHTIANGAYVLVGESASNPGGVDFVLSGTLGLGSGSGGDALQLVDCASNIVDTVVYGGDNQPAFLDDTGVVATSVAPLPGDGVALARKVNGQDTNQSGSDFRKATAATPGAANPAPPPCTASTGTIKINEFLVDPAGTDSTVLMEWVELYNTGGASVSLQGWQLAFASSGDGSAALRGYAVKHTFGNVAIASHDWFVLGETNVAGADEVVGGTLALGSGSNGDGLRLLDCNGTVVDTVVYGGDNTQGVYDDGDAVATSVAAKPGSDQALARRVDGVDTNASAADFAIAQTNSPGATNPAPPLCVPSTGGVVINEILTNPPGSDSDVLLEWVELYNPNATAAITLDGWKIGVATSGATYSIKTTFPTGTIIGPEDYLLIGEANVAGADVVTSGTLALGSGSGGDGVRLIDCADTAVDTVVYGDPTNEQGILDDSGSPATSVAGTPGEGASLGRKANGIDTNLSGDDFIVSSLPTPGAANPVFVCVASNGNVLLNEFLPDPDGSDGEAAEEWVELYNAGSTSVQLDGWGIGAWGKPDDVGASVVLPPDTIIAAGGFFVIGNENVEEADFVTTFAIGNGSGGDALSLLDCEGTLVDTIVYGSSNDDGMRDESGAVAIQAPNPGSDLSLARIDDGVDNDEPDDWFVDGSPTPGATNFQEVIECPECEQPGGGCNGGPPDGGDTGGGCGNNSDAPGEGCMSMPGQARLLPFVLGALIALRRRRPVRA